MDAPMWDPSSFNIFNHMSFSLYDSLPRWHEADPNPIFTSNISREFRDIAWHSRFKTVFPHTQHYKILRAIADDDLELLVNVMKNKKFVIDSIVDAKYQFTALQYAAVMNKYPAIELLLMYGANINKPDVYGNTPLMLAVMNNSLESINSLMKNGCNRGLRNHYGMSPAERAKDQPHIVEFLEGYPQVKRKFPKFRVKLDIEQQLNSPFWSFMKDYKLYVNRPIVYPFNNYKGLYRLSLTDHNTSQ